MNENMQLELQIDQRSRKLAQAADQRAMLESRLAEAARAQESIDQQVDMKTQAVLRQLDEQRKAETLLTAEIDELAKKIANLNYIFFNTVLRPT